MNWTEIIRVRIGGATPYRDITRLLFSLRKAAQWDGLRSARVFSRAGLPASDFSIHLEWQIEGLPSGGSELGVCLARVLKDYGLTDHNVWMEEEEDETAVYSR
ncbi:MAG: hypothetical protein CVU57_12285 [Deltaproteobacteria bacterium HGW-Deltaproteobacteria-15]|nr:MAG: hypothetical protein CVU57_12285 [Deltaproteobacteria bacterium HGW-Deltaproteobacteria-15]